MTTPNISGGSDFDRVHQEITLRAAHNGGPQVGDVLDLMFASHNDAIAREATISETFQKIVREMGSKLDHTTETLHREVMESSRQRTIDIAESARLVRKDLQEYRDTQTDRCAKEHKKLLDREFAEHLTRAPRRAGDPTGANYLKSTSEQTWFEIVLGYRFFRWAVTIVLGTLLIFGASYYAEACAMRVAGAADQQLVPPSPQTSP